MEDNELEAITSYLRLSENLATAGQPSEKQLEAVAEAGFDAVVNLGLLDRDYSLADERGLVESSGLDYVHIPVDFDNPTAEDLEAFLTAMAAAEGKKVFVHCALNMRVSVFAALYRILAQDEEVDEALAAIRKVWEPNETWRAFIERELARRRPDREHG
jgi:uncharacterized protein (TIGR01244 family)